MNENEDKINKILFFILGVILIIIQIIHLGWAIDLYILIIFIILFAPTLFNYLQELNFLGTGVKFKEREKALTEDKISLIKREKDLIIERPKIKKSEELNIKIFLDRIHKEEIKGIIYFFHWLKIKPRYYSLKRIYYHPIEGKPYFLTSIHFENIPKRLREDVKARVHINTLTKETDGYLFNFHKNLIQLSDTGKKILDRLKQIKYNLEKIKK